MFRFRKSAQQEGVLSVLCKITALNIEGQATVCPNYGKTSRASAVNRTSSSAACADSIHESGASAPRSQSFVFIMVWSLRSCLWKPQHICG